MSDDYRAGRDGSSSREDADDPTQFDVGARDRQAAMEPQESGGTSASGSSGTVYSPPIGGGGMDLSGVKEASRQAAFDWAKNPDGALKSMLAVWFGLTVLGGVLGFIAGNVLHDGGLWLTYMKLFFFFASIVYLPMIVVATLYGLGTARGCLTVIFLGGLSAWFVWTYALYPTIFVHIR